MYPLLLTVGPIGVGTGGVVAIIAVWVGAGLAAKETAHRGLPPEAIRDFLWPALLSGLIGARLAYVMLFDPAWYVLHPWQVVTGWRSGLAEEWALLGGLGAAIWWCRRRNLPFWTFADALAPALALAGALAHVGGFLSGAGYGTPTSLPWAITFTDSNSLAPLGIPLHPTQLYEFGVDLALLGGLRLLRRSPAAPGRQLLVFLIGSALIRLAVDPVKADVIVIADTLTSGQMFAPIILIATTVWLLWPFVATRLKEGTHEK